MTRPAPRPTRRQLLRGATGVVAAAATGLGTGRVAAEALGVVVIGSGYAGAVTALRLAQAGISCTVLERGRRWQISPSGDTFATTGNPDARALWVPAAATGVLEVAVGSGITCFAGAGVGGGSLVNYTVLMAPRADLFDASFGGRLDYAEMARVWYPRARDLLGGSAVPDDILATEAYAGARAFDDTCRHAGLATQRPTLAVDWDIVREELRGRVRPSATVGDCMLGINSGAKHSVDRTILAAAEATGAVTVRAMHEVTGVRLDGVGYRVGYQVLDLAGRPQTTGEITTRTVVFAAGSLGTTRLLVRARARGDLPGLPETVGRYWGTAGDHVAIGAGAVHGSLGGPAHIVATDWATTPVTLLSFPLGVPVAGELTRNALAVGITPPLGSIRYDAPTDRTEIHWPAADPAIAAVSSGIGATLAKIDAVRPAPTPTFALPTVTSHALGGAVLGAVTDRYGRVAGHPGLHVVDSALIPGSTGAVPPALTVTALADRCASALVADLTR
ncbi:FAD-dependent oxidoreductase [Nocardia rhizosphaerae]|uniref:Cholesterol oxidase n=1 Tax=Nocardia rhizosphaerae TaxID=1691571 RepID=A0ABV8LAL0_9NOCA